MPAARVGDGGAVADRPDAVDGPRPRRWSSTSTRPFSSSGTERLARLGMRPTPAVQTTVRVGTVSPVESVALLGLDRLERRPQPDLDAAAAQLAHRVVGEGQVDLGQHPVAGLDQDPAHPVQPRARVAVHRVGGEVLELGERLETGVAAADEDVGEQLLAPRRVLGRVRHLERLDHVVAEPDRVGEALEADRVLVEPRDRHRARDRADREHELVVAELLRVSPSWPRSSTVLAAGSWAVTAPSRR